MFKKIAFSGLMLSMLALPLLAQQTTQPTSEAPATAQKNNRMRYQAADPATRARRQTDRIAKELNLDQATTQKLYDAELVRTQKVDDIMKGSDDGRTKNKALKDNADAFKAKLQTILTPDQMTKMEQLKSQMKGRMRNGQGMGAGDNKGSN